MTAIEEVSVGIMMVAVVVWILYIGFQFGVWLKG